MLSRALRLLDETPGRWEAVTGRADRRGHIRDDDAVPAQPPPGVAIAGVADLEVRRAYAALDRAGVAPGPLVTGDPGELLALDGLEVVIEATGAPSAGVDHARPRSHAAATW